MPKKWSYDRTYFFDEGIQFECQGCGVCCTGSPGTVYVDKSEIACIAEFLGISVPDFTKKYLYPYKNSHTIREDSEWRCLFYDNGCEIYPVRPMQCRTFPFWFDNLRSEEKWKRISQECPGIGCGPLYSKERILEIVQPTFVI
ncbi:YkgJ family cysteine cluster protein [Desulfonema magnum]|uniref:Zinc- or iron-chelating domain-containing protein n=1 Tax=Desulfonema magnum TaxID=45655 RepID=A0A975GN08_9BACT|nr:YkgJ family cysteine cluster protein [Desulfonema magnum]QTA87506.1 Putative zinc- or iron-chelating domain-containing protein [Desulfonema magnum]